MSLKYINALKTRMIYEKGSLKRLKKEQYYIKKIKKTYFTKIFKKDCKVIENYFNI